MDYTGAKQINIISHSMGVTLARKVILGGYINADDGKGKTSEYDIQMN